MCLPVCAYAESDEADESPHLVALHLTEVILSWRRSAQFWTPRCRHQKFFTPEDSHTHLPPPPDMVSPVSPETGRNHSALILSVFFPRKDFWWFFQSGDLWDKLMKSEDVLGKGFGLFNSFRFLVKTKVKEFQGNLLKTRLVLSLLSAHFSFCKRQSPSSSDKIPWEIKLLY